MDSQISLIKVFSVTKARDRDEIGERVTAWIAAHPELQIVRDVRQALIGAAVPLPVDGPHLRGRRLIAAATR